VRRSLKDSARLWSSTASFTFPECLTSSSRGGGCVGTRLERGELDKALVLPRHEQEPHDLRAAPPSHSPAVKRHPALRRPGPRPCSPTSTPCAGEALQQLALAWSRGPRQLDTTGLVSAIYPPHRVGNGPGGSAGTRCHGPALGVLGAEANRDHADRCGPWPGTQIGLLLQKLAPRMIYSSTTLL
jgi:hypothetical protein